MNINRNNYEEYFLLYVDNELSSVEREAVETFVQENTDLRGELNMLQEVVARPDKKISFYNKAELMKNSAPKNPVNETNFEEYFILYGDDELSNEEKDFVEQFVYRHPQHQSAFELLQEIRFTADTSVVFPDKQSLYRSEKDERVIVMRWWRIAAAAVILLFLGIGGWIYIGKNDAGKNDPFVSGANNPAIKSSESATTPDNKVENLAQTNEQPIKKIDEANPAQKKRNEIQKAITSKDQPENPLLAENDPKIKTNSDSNILLDSDVKHRGETVAKVEPKMIETEKRIIDEAITFEKLSANDLKPGDATYASNPDDGQIEVLNTTVSNKSKMRGFFRKVGRVVDKATNIGPTDEREDKKGIRIASFQIALK